ncbi:MAG: argininosuccinate lyase [Actinobacteria bacterium]|nr:argininosuccinate lyase [Actinomycetota bacterium]
MKLWGGRFSEEPDKAFLEFSSSIATDSYLWREEILQNAAYVYALNDAGILTDEEKRTIIDALRNMYLNTSAGRPFWSREDEDIHSAVERSLFELIGESALKVHTGRSRNEQIATDLRLFLKRKILEINSGILSIHHSILEKARIHIDDVIPGYTHMQRAQPVRLAHHLLSWFFMLKRDFDRFVSARKKMDFCPLGSGALAGNSFGLNRKLISEMLGFKDPSQNSMDAVSDRDFVLHFLSQAVNLILHISRFSEEIICWNTKEFGFVEVGEKYSTGSSLMPQKKNPDSLELIRAFSGRVIGAWVQVATVLKSLPLTYNRDLQEDRVFACEISENMCTVLRIFSDVIRTLHFDVERMKEAASDEYLLATDIADYLVRKGVPFRKAHEIVGRVVKHSEESGKKLSEIELDELKSISPIFEDDYYEIFNIELSLEKKTSVGGTSRSSVLTQIKIAEEIVVREENWIKEEEDKQRKIFERLFGSAYSNI